jgi:hypothetical protein
MAKHPSRLILSVKTKVMEHVTRVIARDDFQLELMFDTGELKVFDVKPYLDKCAFQRLRDVKLFKQAYVGGGTVCWPQDLDIAPETLYDRSVRS